MKKTFTNGEIFTIANVLFGGRENEGFVKKGNLKITMSVRHALIFNYIAIQNANKVIEEMINDIIKEISIILPSIRWWISTLQTGENTNNNGAVPLHVLQNEKDTNKNEVK